jgi:hypothetical protein
VTDRDTFSSCSVVNANNKTLPGAMMLHKRVLVVLPLFLCSVIAVVGCGAKNPLAPASVSGGVSYKGSSVTGGSVQFVTSGGTPYSSPIALDGTYAISDIPTGEMAIVVETESVNPALKAATGKDAERRSAMMGGRKGPNDQGGGSKGLEPKYMKIPEKYSNSKTSPITYTVKSGRQVYNIELE